MFFFQINSWILVLIFLIITTLIGLLFIFISNKVSNLFFQDIEKISEYECGFEPFDNATRQPFNIHFYIVGLLFLLFDVEITVLFPISIYFSNFSWVGFWFIILFLFILILGLIYEWKLVNYS